MDDGLGGDFSTVYDGKTNPQVTSYTAEDLEPGRDYQFIVQAVDINGAGTETSPLSISACVSPSGLERPTITSIAGASYTVRWSSPLNDGGCAIESVTIYRDDGAGSDITTLVQVITDGSLSFTDTLTLADQGKTFRVSVTASNGIGTVSSSATSFVLADLPAAPTPKPTSDSDLTNTQQIKVDFENTNTDTGGASILQYCLEMDDGLGGVFVEVFCSTHETSYLTTDVVRGRNYRFRYRVRNAAGWSDYSETSYITPSTQPEAPPQPQFSSGSDTQIVLLFEESPDDNGVPIEKYQLEIDAGDDLTSSFSVVSGYAGLTMSYTLDSVVDSLGAPGTLYRVRLAAINENSIMSDYSEVLLVALGSLPSKPSAPTKNMEGSSANSILVQWSEVTGNTLSIQGYKLWADSGRADDFTLVFDGSNSPGIREYLFMNADVDLTYRFRVGASNINGDGSLSNIASLVSCTTPTGFSAPTIGTVTQTTVTLSWKEPTGKGGCPITGYAIFWAPESGTFTEYDAVNVNGKPFLTKFTIDLSTQTVGSVYQIYVDAVNRAGSVSSDTVSFILASVPDQPILATSDSDGNYLEIIMTAPSNGGSTIVTYQLQVDLQDGKGFTTIAGGDSKHTLTLKHTISGDLLATGERYRTRYRAKNKVGWSAWSEIAYLLVAGTPSTPPAPTLSSAESGAIEINLLSVESDNVYYIWVDSGDFASEVYTVHGTATSGDTTYNVTGLNPGSIYRIGITAENEAGNSTMSALGVFAASAPPSAPSSLTKDMSKSSETSIALSWPKVTETDKTVYGYIVTMAVSGSSNFETVYDGSSNAQVLSYVVQGLATGEEYKFKIKTVGFNGPGDDSSEYAFRSCIVPTGFAVPTGVSDTSSITISWTEPTYNGGCPVTGYAIYRNDGDQTDPTIEVNSNDDSAIRNNPSLRTATITYFPSSPEGLTFLFKVRVFTAETDTYSPALSIKLAGIPGTPSNEPTLVQEDTDTTQITVELGEVTDSGNDSIVTYNLQIDDGNGGAFSNVAGYSSRTLQRTHTIKTGISRGKYYRIRYRVGNSVGWSDFSPILVAQAAKEPSAPPEPTLASSSATEIELNLFESLDNQGSSIQLYELWMNAGTDGSAFSMIYSTTTLPSTFDVTNALHGIASGSIYIFKIRAQNGIGYSEYSTEARYAAANLPAPPVTLQKVSDMSNSTQITLEWSQAADTEIVVNNYRLYESYNADEYKLIYDGGLNVLQRQFTYKGSLVRGGLYSFKVSALNLNGEGANSTVVSIYACDAPSQPAVPTRVSSTTTTITLTWIPPTTDGGCSLTGYSLLTDSGTGGAVTTEVDTSLNTSPETLTKTVTFSGTLTGSWIRFKLIAYNSEDSSTSRVVQYMLAQTPSKPLSAPSEVSDETTEKVLVAQASQIVSPENGGTSITGYEFQVDDGNYGEYTTVQGGSGSRTLSLKAYISYGIVKGKTYRVRYRGINSVGEGEWSDPVEIIASTTPSRPETPIIASASNTSIDLVFTPITDNGGEDLTAYELFFSDSGVSLSTFSNDSSYDGSSMTYSFTSVTIGNIFGFKIRAVNSRGESDFSDIVYAAAGNAPDTPLSSPTHDLDNSNRTHAMITWAEGVSDDIPVLGYRLYADDRGNGEFEVVYDGNGKPNVLTFLHGPLQTGESYQYYIEVLNYNGASGESPYLTATICEVPEGFSSLQVMSSSDTQVKISWQPPTNNGGCAISYYEQYSDSGAGGALALETGSISSTTLEQTIDVSGSPGSTFRLQIYAYNTNGFVKSNIISVVAADVPADPTTAPSIVASLTDSTQITVSIAQITDTGSSPITSYELQRDWTWW
jgi:titin